MSTFWLTKSDYAGEYLYRYLLPHERQEVAVRFHPAALIWPVGAAFAGVLGALLASPATTKISPDDKIFIWTAWAILFIYAAKRVIYWATSHYVITNYRMLVIKGVFTRDVEMVPIASVATLKMKRTFTGLMLGYGRFIVEGVGQVPELRVINYIPYPEQVYLEACALVFPERSAVD
jgi:uncharacterized membrane protein YdbT with pleckstrin-like domain